MFDDNIKLSPTMRKYLKTEIQNMPNKFSMSTIKALVKRGLSNEEGQLTDKGKILAVANLSLAKQCVQMKLPLEIIYLQYERSPEEALMKYLVTKNNIVYWSENTFGFHVAEFFLFKFNYLKAKSENRDLSSMIFNAYFIDDDFEEVLDERLNAINEKLIVETYELITRLNKGVEKEELPNFYQDIWGLDFYLNIFKYFGSEILKQYIKFILYNYTKFRRGWPDLIVLNDGFPYFIEVKTTDKISIHQIYTFRKILEQLKIPIKCVKIIKKNKII